MGQGEAPQLPSEPVIALDTLESEEALLHPLDCATRTIGEAFADAPITHFLAKEGHKVDFTRALVNLYRSSHAYEVVEARDFSCVAMIREVPESPPASQQEDEEEAEQGAEQSEQGSEEETLAGLSDPYSPGRRNRPDASRAASSANVESPVARRHARPDPFSVLASHKEGEGPSAVDPSQLQAALEKGSLSALLAAGVPRLEADLLVHLRPERLGALQALQTDLEAIAERYCQAHGPLLHLHFLATLPSARGSGLGRVVLTHLERMADAEKRSLYLEATSEDSRRLYLRHGFQDVEQYPLGGEADPVFYIMARPPGAKSAASSASELADEQAAAEEGAEEQAAAGAVGAEAEGKAGAAAGRAAGEAVQSEE